MPDPIHAGGPTAPGAAPGTKTTSAATAEAAEAAEAADVISDKASKLAHHPKVQRAITLAKEHPLGAVVTVAAAAAFIEVPFAMGILTGLGAASLLTRRSGPEAREQVLARGTRALDRARVALASRRKPTASTVATSPAAASPPSTTAAAPPS
jgi:hypothetical protein